MGNLWQILGRGWRSNNYSTLFKFPHPPLLSEGRKHFWVFIFEVNNEPEKSILSATLEQFSLFADARHLNSHFFENEVEALVVGYSKT